MWVQDDLRVIIRLSPNEKRDESRHVERMGKEFEMLRCKPEGAAQELSITIVPWSDRK
jgi:hypothetical protein